MVPHGLLMGSHVLRDPVWSAMVPHGPLWALMVSYGPLWFLMVPSRYVCLHVCMYVCYKTEKKTGSAEASLFSITVYHQRR